MHCRRMAATAPQALAMEFERLAQTWARLADDLERAQTFTESPPDSSRRHPEATSLVQIGESSLVETIQAPDCRNGSSPDCR